MKENLIVTILLINGFIFGCIGIFYSSTNQQNNQETSQTAECISPYHGYTSDLIQTCNTDDAPTTTALNSGFSNGITIKNIIRYVI